MKNVNVWIAFGGILVIGGTWLAYWIRIRMLRIPVLRVLHERGTLDFTGTLKALREAELYPLHTPEFFIKDVLDAGIKKGLMVHGGHAIIPRFTISNKGLDFLDQYLWRKGKKKFPAQ